MSICFYYRRTPDFNALCENCPDHFINCQPILGQDGFSNGECDCYLCPGCYRQDCPNQALINC